MFLSTSVGPALSLAISSMPSINKYNPLILLPDTKINQIFLNI